ncbi:YFBL-like protein [Mya arenaria]|uniref:YFBL-like protein n=1 Tax=Mya arenaria TaxID=6604 RepID=A0ABY7D7Z3_MYAAR|nr:YFBL-like protein [Mya arenaria]
MLRVRSLFGFKIVLLLICIAADSAASSDADLEYLNSTLRDNFSNSRNHISNAVYKQQSRDFIIAEFRRFELEVEFHNFTSDVVGAGDFQNIIGVLRGKYFGTKKDQIVGVGAHYDTVIDTKGVDDNGSGITALLYVAREISKQRNREHTIMFLAFDVEEYDLTGSKVLLTDWLPVWSTTHWGNNQADFSPKGFIILDTILEYESGQMTQDLPPGSTDIFMFRDVYNSVTADNFTGDFLASIYRSVSDGHLNTAFKESWDKLEQREFEIETFALPFEDIASIPESQLAFLANFGRSDHFNFWLAGIPALFLTDTVNFRGNMTVCYHKPCDDLETMFKLENLQFLGKTSLALKETINALSPVLKDSSSGSAQDNKMCWTVLIICLFFAFKGFYNLC